MRGLTFDDATAILLNSAPLSETMVLGLPLYGDQAASDGGARWIIAAQVPHLWRSGKHFKDVSWPRLGQVHDMFYILG